MIDHVTGGEFLNVYSSKGYTPYISPSNLPMQGTVSYDSNTNNMRVYDGASWQTISGGTANINLTSNAIEVLKWAEKKMYEEREYEHLAKTNPTIKSLIDEMNKYKDQIEMVKVLLKSPGNEPIEMMGS
jgi:hypothetical protein